MTSEFQRHLCATGPTPFFKDKMALYGRFVGDWRASRIEHGVDGTRRELLAEIHFDWVLEGRAVQDVWISPRVETRTANAPLERSLYGSTFRIYDPEIDGWRIHWFNPSSGEFDVMIGRPDGDDIVQLGTRSNGIKIRWSFREITDRSFHWLGERETDTGGWRLVSEFLAVRSDPADSSRRRTGRAQPGGQRGAGRVTEK
jgi:hypothetical protein